MRYIFKIGIFAMGFSASMLAGAEELGRLFFTPEQRAQLNYAYSREDSSDRNTHALTLNGIVQRQGGERTVWINGVPHQAGSSDDKKPDSQSVPLPGQSKSVKLKVGQRVLLNPSASPDATQTDAPNQDSPKP